MTALPRLDDGPIGAADLAAFERDGYLKVRGLFTEGQRGRVLEGIERLLHLKGATRGSLHERILELAARDRSQLGKVYDAIRKLQAFWALVGSERLADAASTLLGTQTLGVAFRGAGIRLDLPNEDKWRSQWHQEYHSQLSSPRGVVAWFSLVSVTSDMGPVRIARGSHREGVLPVRCDDPMNKGKDYTQTFQIPNVEALLAKYPVVEHETEGCEVVFLDFMTLHQSGWNRSPGRSRVTAQVRFFDMTHPTAVANDWVGGWQDGGDFTRVHPDKVLR
ncbi:MAG: phytanoyl-CoA dioxygenase family protein [Archangiaceae bacterium]|nr:phytanoyl-CoA dioxygenase family protein [Archangiaceae bacterium]